MNNLYLVLGINLSMLTFLYVYLSFKVIQYRHKNKIAFLTNDDVFFIRNVRAHANFAEYVPISLLLLAVSAYLSMPLIPFVLLNVLLFAGRMSHAYSFTFTKTRESHLKGRVLGMITTFICMIVCAIYNLIKAFYFINYY